MWGGGGGGGEARASPCPNHCKACQPLLKENLNFFSPSGVSHLEKHIVMKVTSPENLGPI